MMYRKVALILAISDSLATTSAPVAVAKLQCER